jgi:hypothetical protein
MSTPRVAMDEVVEVLSEAVNRAREQGALLWQLRLSLTLAKAHAFQGKDEEAREIVEHVYSRFTEGFETNDLRTAAQALHAM